MSKEIRQGMMRTLRSAGQCKDAEVDRVYILLLPKIRILENFETLFSLLLTCCKADDAHALFLHAWARLCGSHG